MDKAPDAFRTISEVAEDLDLPQHVLRFWETRFAQIKPMKRGGGRRYYRPDDIDLLRGIRHLLYGEGYTIRGVQRILKDEGARFVQSVWRTGAPQLTETPGDSEEIDEPMLSLRAAPNGEAPVLEAGRSRRLFGILPSLLGGGEPEHAIGALERRGDRVEPALEDVDEPADDGSLMGASAHTSARRCDSLSRDAVHALRATLDELGECKRLLDAAIAEE